MSTIKTNYYENDTIWKIYKFIGFAVLSFTISIPLSIKNVLLASIILIILSLFVWKYFKKKYNEQLIEYNPNGFGWHKITIKNVLFMLFILILYFCFLYLGTKIIAMNFTYDRIIISPLNNNLSLAASIRRYIITPIIEEFLYRGIFFNYFFNKKDKQNNLLVILTSAIIFASIHIQYGFPIYYFFGSLILGITYMYTKDLRYTILIHSIVNLFVTNFSMTPS